MEESRREYSLRRLTELSTRLDPVSDVLGGPHALCVYATGSYGRLEAWTQSDIDLFFLYDGADDGAAFPYTDFLRLGGRLVEATEAMEFPPFSGDGKYLEVQYVSQMERILGSREDDALNAFTARMLLLLESRPVRPEITYERLLERIVGFYYRDFDDHAADFVPVFLMNDILRFWRTLTLNYEHHRLKLQELEGEELEAKKADSALKNYKLKVSRITTCFSMVAQLAAATAPVTQGEVVGLCRMTPSARLAALRSCGEGVADTIDDLARHYESFLAATQRPEAELLTEFRDPARRKEALDAANRYGDLIFELLRRVAPDRRMRYLVI